MSEIHILNWGMGVESTAIALRWILEPELRPFPLDRLILLTAQTGNEMQETKMLSESCFLPMLAQHNIRLVQVAKAGLKKEDGYSILSDSKSTETLYTEGHYKLSDNLLASGTIPLLGRPHTCAQRWKAEVLDSWVYNNYGTENLTRYLGFNSEEKNRAANEYGKYQFYYPLIDWEWTRQHCLDYIEDNLGIVWVKSACAFCPFSSRMAAIEKYQRDPAAAAFTLLIERVALAFNPRMNLFSSGKAFDLILSSGNTRALEEYQQLLNKVEWALYRVQRVYRTGINCDRKTTTIAIGSRTDMEGTLQNLADERRLEVIEQEGLRVYVFFRQKGYPTFEEFYVCAPALAKDKCRNPLRFNSQWEALLNPQLSLAI